YPPAPQILNPGDLSSHDLSQPFTINWSAFPNYDPEDQVIIEVWNVTDEQDLLFEFLPPETTSYEIPGNTFSPESQYELSVLFINETDGLETPEPDMVIGYLTRTRVVLSTSTSDTELFFYKFLRYEQVGGGSESLEENGYLTSASVTANSNSVTFAMLNTVTGSFQLNNPSVNPFFLNTLWNDKAEMDAAYPSGEFHFYLEENGSGRSYAPYYLPPDAYPVPAVIENFSELEIFDASMDQTVSWSPAGEDVTQILVRVTEGLQEVWSMQLDPSATSVVIPANSLAQYKNYRLAVGFWSKQTGSEFPAASLGYTTTTFMSVLTTPPVIDFAGWVQFRFSQQQQENQDIVGQDADPDGDKLTNYLEYLIGADPMDPNSGLTYRVEGTTLIINPVPGGATWELRGSSDFINWSPLAAESYEVFFESIYIYLDTLPSPTFIRLVFSDA
ncbi:MAG: hypothetical protein KJT03_15485, partial [Verrucomicrobiae bacterium]|nr:hypothetical protein [Verrucomicrobiae bacterium]